MSGGQRFERLWAKRWTGEGPAPVSVYLPGHLRDVYATARTVVNETADAQLRALGLDVANFRSRLERVVLVAAAVHDLGKANDHFQGMICGNRRQPQAVRHEWVTYYILTRSEWSEWLRTAFEQEADWHIMLWCVTGHHPAYSRPSPPRQVPPGAGSQMKLLLGHSDFRDATDWIAREFCLSSPPSENDLTVSLSASAAGGLLAEVNRLFLKDRLIWQKRSEAEKKLTAAAKACLIGTDVAGSALPHQAADERERAHWLQTVLRCVPSSDDLRGLVRERLGNNTLRQFQKQIAETNARVVLVRAGCGTGKTLAAYNWAAQRCSGRRVYICYPTTGTATEGFRDYLFDPEEARSRYGARLFHSRAEVDFGLLLHAEEPSDTTDELIRVESLQAWATPIVCCTVDTVLGLIQNQRRALYSWPALAQSAFVFDEIHAYDEKLFGAFLRFLDAMRGVPILLMTASLPAPQYQAIKQCVGKTGESLDEIDGPDDLETLKRYHWCRTDQPEAAVREELRRGGKVLWVCNTVGRAMDAADRLADCRPLLYHSRFRYEDRVARHADLIDAFRRDGPALAVCTQVAEMSLDISASLLVTDLAPVPSLIQRLGRLNRRAVPAAGGLPAPETKPFIVVEPLQSDGRLLECPYDREHYGPWPDNARQWLDRLGTGPLSQRDLAEAWQELQSGRPPRPIDSKWLDGGPVTLVDAVRDASPGLTVLLPEDAEAVRRGQKSAAQVALPMPPPPSHFSWQSWERIRGLFIAPRGTIAYDVERGARWKRNENDRPIPNTQRPAI